MITSQRLLLIGIFLNLFMGLLTHAYYNEGEFKEDLIQDLAEQTEQSRTEAKSQEGIYGSIKGAIQKVDTTITSVYVYGKAILKLFIMAMWPFSVPVSNFTGMNRIIAMIITLFRVCVTALVLVEVYLLYKNRKAT